MRLRFERRDQLPHVTRYRRLPGHRLARHRMHEAELFRVKGLAVEVTCAPPVRTGAINRITEYRVTDRCGCTRI